MKISIIIPNWNGEHLLAKNLPKVIASSPNTEEIIIVDDCSTDGSLRLLRNKFPKVKVIARPVHEGFASSVNDGVAQAAGDIVVLLNTDVAPGNGFLEPLAIHFRDPDVFAVGCLEKSLEQGKTILRGRGLAHWVKGFYIHKRGEVDKMTTAWVSGGSGAFRKKMWDQLGGMDTLYNPFYWEDIDLCYRARKVGWRTLFEPKSIVAHYHEEGKIISIFTPRDIKKIAFRNQFIFVWKNTTDLDILLSHALWTPIRLLQAILCGDILMLRGYILALQKLPQVVIHRFKDSSLFKKSDAELVEWEK